MDEPFGALDPITRARLQQELRRLHAQIPKTVIFVTHDVDEAITMGDRIAILREGGILVQYDTPDAILAHPADEFVARFVGEDRALRRLALRRVGELELDPAPNPASDDLPLVSSGGDGAERALADARGGRRPRARRRRRRRAARRPPARPRDRAAPRMTDAAAAGPGHPELRQRRASACSRTGRSAGTGCASTGATRSSRALVEHVELTLIAVADRLRARARARAPRAPLRARSSSRSASSRR